MDGYNDRYHHQYNQIPFCLQDAKTVAQKGLQGDQETRIDRRVYQSMA